MAARTTSPGRTSRPRCGRRRARRGIHLSCALLLAFLFATAFPHGLSLWDHSPAKAEVPQTDQSGPAAEASPQSVIERAKTLIDAHEVDEAVDLLNKFIASSPTEYLDHAYLLMAAALSGWNPPATSRFCRRTPTDCIPLIVTATGRLMA